MPKEKSLLDATERMEAINYIADSEGGSGAQIELAMIDLTTSVNEKSDIALNESESLVNRTDHKDHV